MNLYKFTVNASDTPFDLYIPAKSQKDAEQLWNSTFTKLTASKQLPAIKEAKKPVKKTSKPTLAEIQAKWDKIVDQFVTGGIKVAKFCKKHKIDEGALYRNLRVRHPKHFREIWVGLKEYKNK